jgi:hypothetical protein
VLGNRVAYVDGVPGESAPAAAHGVPARAG